MIPKNREISGMANTLPTGRKKFRPVGCKNNENGYTVDLLMSLPLLAVIAA
jgi:hypothetical protein